MTSEKRAEKILTSVRDANPGFPRSFQQDVDFVAAEIREAEFEAGDAAARICGVAMEQSVKVARMDAYEDAAKIILRAFAGGRANGHGWVEDRAEYAADQIRARAKEIT